MDCKTALLTLLDQIDYTAGNCRPNEMVGAVLSKEIIAMCRQAIKKEDSIAGTCRCGLPVYHRPGYPGEYDHDWDEHDKIMQMRGE